MDIRPDYDGAALTTVDQISSLAASTWTQRTVQGAAPEDSEYVQVWIGMFNTPAIGQQLYVDDIEQMAAGGYAEIGAGSFVTLAPI